MEQVIYRKRTNKKLWLIPLIGFCLIMLVPSSIVFANAFTQPTIGMNEVTDSDLTVGMTGITSSDRLIDFGNNGHINPTSVGFPVMMLIPLIFFFLALLLLLAMVFGEGLNIKGLIMVAILITIALALLASVNFSVNTLVGG